MVRAGSAREEMPTKEVVQMLGFLFLETILQVVSRERQKKPKTFFDKFLTPPLT